MEMIVRPGQFKRQTGSILGHIKVISSVGNLKTNACICIDTHVHTHTHTLNIYSNIYFWGSYSYELFNSNYFFPNALLGSLKVFMTTCSLETFRNLRSTAKVKIANLSKKIFGCIYFTVPKCFVPFLFWIYHQPLH